MAKSKTKKAAQGEAGSEATAPRLTPARRRALEILRKAEPDGLSPSGFAKLMWPDSPGFSRHSKCGPYGVTRGGGMRLAAGGYLGKLVRVTGWVGYRSDRYHCPIYYITSAGERVLEQATAGS